ncbi:MAG: M24 family metallopeptidase [Candidatus Hodarchaeota archaeon]
MVRSKIYTDRIAKLKSQMRKLQIGSVIVSLGTNFRYLFGLMEEASERLLIGIIEADNSPKMLVPSFEIDRIKEQTGIEDCVGWEETHDPYDQLQKLLSIEAGRKIAIEPKMWFSTYQRISKKLPERELISAEILLNPLRSVKDDYEQELLLKASQKSGDAIVDTFNELEIGISETEVKVILKEKLLWGLKEKIGALVQFGENSSLPHYPGGDRKLKKNDVVLIDAGGTIENYWGDITITTVFGKASRRFKEIYDIVYTANKRGKEAVIANKLPSKVDSTTREYISIKGYGEYFTHRTGHGIGLEVHEHPYIVGNNHIPLIPGNVFTIEPGIYLPGEFGVRIEDNILKTETGIQMSQIPRYEIIEI